MIRNVAIILGSLLFLAVVGFGLLRAIHVGSYPLRQGGASISPDKQYLAELEGVYDEDFWGNKLEHYRFRIFPKKKIYPDGSNYEWELQPLAELSVNLPLGQPLIMSRGTPPFPSRWSTDSSSLEIDYYQSKITLYAKKIGRTGRST